jgi:hypothetical protein
MKLLAIMVAAFSFLLKLPFPIAGINIPATGRNPQSRWQSTCRPWSINSAWNQQREALFQARRGRPRSDALIAPGDSYL